MTLATVFTFPLLLVCLCLYPLLLLSLILREFHTAQAGLELSLKLKMTLNL